MQKIAFFIDGFNLYHSLKANPSLNKFKWLDLRKLSYCFVKDKNTINKIYYFTALATWNHQKVKRYQKFIRIQEYNDITVIYGEFRRKTKRCPNCGKIIRTFEEKETDVNIASSLFELAYRDIYDTAMIISGDSDLIPAIKAVRKNFPTKQFCILIPPGRRAELLKKEADFYKKIKLKHLQWSRLPDSVDIDNNGSVECPQKWKT